MREEKVEDQDRKQGRNQTVTAARCCHGNGQNTQNVNHNDIIYIESKPPEEITCHGTQSKNAQHFQAVLPGKSLLCGVQPLSAPGNRSGLVRNNVDIQIGCQIVEAIDQIFAGRE